MKAFFASLVAALTLPASAADVVNVAKMQPVIVGDQIYADEHLNTVYSGALARGGLARFVPTVPSYSNQGKLFASWNPMPANAIGKRPTFIVIHGGHGVGGTNLENAMWLQRTFSANVLLLDSYVSRGRTENWATLTEYGADMRMLDTIAAARFTKSRGADPARTFVVGDSQGGWTTLRTMTAGHDHAGEVSSLFRGGIALYPNCYAKESWFGKVDGDFAPPLGPYQMPLVVFTGSADTATPIGQCNVDKALKSAEQWLHFDGATHAFDAPSGGIGNKAIDGKCFTAANKYNHFAMCRSDKYTAIMYSTIREFVVKHAGADALMAWQPPTFEQKIEGPQYEKTTDQAEIDRRTQEIMKSMKIK